MSMAEVLPDSRYLLVVVEAKQLSAGLRSLSKVALL